MIPETAIRNAQGQVALKWVLPRPPKIVKIDGTDRVYTFSYNQHVCGAWVNEEDVPRLLAVREKTCNCNSGIYKQAFEYQHLLDNNLWVYGNREGISQ
jgi:hypothetical protein